MLKMQNKIYMDALAHTNWISLCKIDLPTKLEIEVYGFYQWQSEARTYIDEDDMKVTW